MHCRVQLDTLAASQPEPVPESLRGLGNDVLADPASFLDPVPPSIEGAAFWPADIMDVSFDPRTHALSGSYDLDVRPDERRVTAMPLVRELTADEIGTLPQIVYQVLGKGEFIDHVLSTGVTIAQVRAAAEDDKMADFWFLLDRFYSQIRRDHHATRQGLAGMAALGHVTDAQVQQVFETWPRLP